ncbi:MAG TPA: cell wall hydrolase, partial [Lachnospiraceae bacterium]|nr:cell wall hydrolase [Lachnospiraceae bacterium]
SSSGKTGSYADYSDLDLLAAIIWCEAGNQPYDGMVAVGEVVMNRVASSSFPNTIAEVLEQPGQFTPYSSGTLQSALASGVNSTCYQAAQDALNGAQPVPGALYFNTHSGTTKLGAHYFS